MKDLNKQKRIKHLRKIQGIPTVGEIAVEMLVGFLLFTVVILLYALIKVI